ncbi:MAG TPA: hypothetical protein VMT64_13980 [Candidatus Binataceae bacterium]|nr:hypothetical protein [Candidatus Binataceae bacterium]
MAHGKHQFEIVGAWGSKLCSMAGWRCARCDVLYVTKNLTADPTKRIFAMDPDGCEIDLEEMYARNCES